MINLAQNFDFAGLTMSLNESKLDLDRLLFGEEHDEAKSFAPRNNQSSFGGSSDSEAVYTKQLQSAYDNLLKRHAA